MPSTPESDWSTRLAAVVGERVRHHRTLARPKISAQKLADRTAQLGHPLTRSTIAGMESGRRGTVTVADLLVLAAALAVPPVALVFPVGSAPTTEYLPSQHIDTLVGAEWFSGRARVEPADVNSWTRQTQALELSRAASQMISRWEKDIQNAVQAPDEYSRDFFTQSANADLEQARLMRKALRDNGFRPPAVDNAAQARALGEGIDDAS